MPVIENCTFCYVHIRRPTKKYESEATEFSVDAVIPKSEVKAWNAKFKKQKAKVIDNEDFEKQYKIAPPFPDQEEQYIVKAKKDTHYKDGNALSDEHRPKVFKRNAKGKLENITNTVSVANGSQGALSYAERNSDYGPIAKLTAIRVDNLIVYADSSDHGLGDEDDDSGFEETTANGLGEEETPAPKETPKPTAKSEGAKPKSKTKAEGVAPKDAEDGDGPF